MTVHEIKKEIRGKLTETVGSSEAEAMAKMILEEVKGYTPVEQVMYSDRTLLPETVERIRGIVRRVDGGEPLQYVLGKAWWHGRTFNVNPSVLIPRPETSQLVDMIVDENKGRSDLNVLDIGTGSGCIAVTLACDLRYPKVDAIDKSERAVETAKENAVENKATVTFHNIDVFHIEDSSLAEKKYDIIVSNPPYILESERDDIDPRVKEYEPQTALFVDNDKCMDIYRKIIGYAASNLNNGGTLYLEINPLCTGYIKRVLDDGWLQDIEIIRDYKGTERFATASKR